MGLGFQNRKLLDVMAAVPSYTELSGYQVNMVSAKIHPSYLDFVHDIASLCQDKYYEFVFSFSEQHYQERIDMSGFHGGRKVLDAGCGYGQWAGAWRDATITLSASIATLG